MTLIDLINKMKIDDSTILVVDSNNEFLCQGNPFDIKAHYYQFLYFEVKVIEIRDDKKLQIKLKI